MSLGSGMVLSSGRVRDLAHRLSGFLNELEKRMPGDEATRHAFINARQTVGFIHAECTEMETLAAAARMTGDLGQPVMAEDLELHPKNLPVQVDREKLLESLHRAGDHSLDEEETERTGVSALPSNAGGGA